jgi:hypothetical protein
MQLILHHHFFRIVFHEYGHTVHIVFYVEKTFFLLYKFGMDIFYSSPSLQPSDLIDCPFASPTRNQSVHSVSTESLSASWAYIFSLVRHQYVV